MLRNWRKILVKKVYEALPKEYRWKTSRDTQHEADIHRLFLLTEFWRRSTQGLESCAASFEQISESVISQAGEIPFQEQKLKVEGNLNHQVNKICGAVHEVLCERNDPFISGRSDLPRVPNSFASRPASNLVAAGVSDLRATAVCQEAGAALSMADLAVALRERLGFCLRVARSSVPHREAGNGLWLEGRAPLGSVVALYPGVVYSSEQYRFIPGYPAIDKGNSYIVGRYDGAVIDAKPWGAGDPAGGSPWPPIRVGGEPRSAGVEGRNPFALAHFANHPPAGAEPNVVVASLDAFPARLGALRRYVPNVTYAELSAATDAAAADADPAVPALCFVATRDLEDEELLLNYRYSPHVRRPSWYVPVDAEEDERRWD